MSYLTEKVEFKNKQGTLIAGKLERPPVPVRAFAIFAHCFTCSKDVHAATRISRALTSHGIAVLRFDFTGLGNSAGDFSYSNFTSNKDDLLSAYEYLQQSVSTPQLLIGHSLGGAACLAAAGDMPEVRAVVTIGAPSNLTHLENLFSQHLDEIEKQGEGKVQLGGRELIIRKQFLDDIRSIDLSDKIQKLTQPLLILHSPIDEIVSIDHAKKIYDRAHHPKSFISLDQADHLLSDKKDSQYVAGLIAAWVEKYLDVPAKVAPVEGEVLVASVAGSSFQQIISSGRHQLLADEPEEFGGSDEGFSPYDLLLSSLGACSSMTIALYARKKRLPLEGVEIRLNHKKTHAQDCLNCDSEESLMDVIERRIKLSGVLSEEQKSKLIEIANKCPVHRTLTSTISIQTVADDNGQ